MNLKKVFLYLFYLTPILYWLYLGLNQKLGADPIDLLNWQTGYVVLYLFVFNLALGVWLALVGPRPHWLRFFFSERRSLGVACGFYVILHFLSYLVDESFATQAWEQIATKFYLQMGFLSMLVIGLLTVTSNSFSQKKLGYKNWKRLHRLVYLAFALIILHVMNIEKGNLWLLGLLTLPLIPLQVWRLLRSFQK